MIYTIIDLTKSWLKTHGLYGPLHVFTYPEFRAALAIIVAFGLVLVAGRPVIRWLLKQKVGDNPEFHHKSLNELMRNKANTPTMGGLLINGAILVTTFLLADLRSFYVTMAVICLIWLAVVGGFDDWLKLTAARRKPGSRHGLYTWEKLLLQLGLAMLLGLFVYDYGQNTHTIEVDYYRQMTRALVLPFTKTWQYSREAGGFVPADGLIMLGQWTFVLIAMLVITGSSNAVNLTDGMDGLAGGVMSIVAFAFMLLALIAGYRHEGTDFILAQYLLVPYVPMSSELAIVAGAMTGACLGFLWFNCNPAQVFMGDTGSLALGGVIGYIAIVIRQEFLLLIVGGIFVFEAVSVVMQVGYFKATGGRRIFRCAPVHHHYHLGGLTEQQVVVRFWLVTAILAAAALATIKLR